MAGGKRTKNQVNNENKKAKNKFLTIFCSNVNGILGKKDSLISNIKKFQPGAFLLQETKVQRKGQIKVENYEIFEVVRPNCPNGGSILTGVHKNLHPVFISGGEDNIEILVIQAKVGVRDCRFINGYGPQEYQLIEERIRFYARLEQEVINAKCSITLYA